MHNGNRCRADYHHRSSEPHCFRLWLHPEIIAGGYDAVAHLCTRLAQIQFHLLTTIDLDSFSFHLRSSPMKPKSCASSSPELLLPLKHGSINIALDRAHVPRCRNYRCCCPCRAHHSGKSQATGPIGLSSTDHQNNGALVGSSRSLTKLMLCLLP